MQIVVLDYITAEVTVYTVPEYMDSAAIETFLVAQGHHPDNFYYLASSQVKVNYITTANNTEQT